MKKFIKRLSVFFGILFLLFLAFLLYFKWAVLISPPVPENLDVLKNKRTELDSAFYVCGNNWLRYSKSGLWEMYIEGEAFERGAIKGILAKDLIYRQEKAFVDEIKKIIPSPFYLKFLKYFIAWFAKDLDKYIDYEYQLEIFGISHAASEEFSFVGPAYLRFLNYHAAHDLGHALQNLGMVGCTSFAVWDDAGEDSLLIVGRNFDFYVGESFSEEKIVAFYAPENGHKFMFITWGGMMGVVSGMNEKGLTVTINAAASDMPFKAKTPVSIVAREILQYAQNIEEALFIAESKETFVAESILIGSAIDNKAIIIEKGVKELGLFKTDKSKLICTNHFQSVEFAGNKLNINSIETSSSPYRYERVRELLSEKIPLNHKTAAVVLRDQKGHGGKNIGMGNEKAINQLIAHHSVIFVPAKGLVWVSTAPYQLGKYVAYDIHKVFSEYAGLKENIEIYEPHFEIPADSFLYSQYYENFESYKVLKKQIEEKTKSKRKAQTENYSIETLISLNPEYYLVYSIAGDYYKSQKQYDKAVYYYELALEKEVTTLDDVKRIKNRIATCQKKK